MNEIEKIISRLNSAIKNSGYSYAELEKRSGISKSALQRYATGKTKKIPLEVINNLAPILSVTPSYLMGWEDNNVSPLGDYDKNVQFLKDKNQDDLIHLYDDIIENDRLSILFDKAKQLSPEDLEQVLKIIDTFNKESS